MSIARSDFIIIIPEYASILIIDCRSVRKRTIARDNNARKGWTVIDFVQQGFMLGRVSRPYEALVITRRYFI